MKRQETYDPKKVEREPYTGKLPLYERDQDFNAHRYFCAFKLGFIRSFRKSN